MSRPLQSRGNRSIQVYSQWVVMSCFWPATKYTISNGAQIWIPHQIALWLLCPSILQKLLSCSPVFTGCECRAWLCWIHPRTPTQRHFAGHLKCVQSQESWGPKVPRIQGNRDCSGYLRRGECIFQPHRESHRNETFSVRSSSRCKWRWLREGNRFWKSHH